MLWISKNKIGIKNTIGIKEGIKDTVNWFKLNKDSHYKKYNSFLENK
jgi:hypothetical protein